MSANAIRENWESIPGFEGRYEVSDMGRVRRLARTTHNRCAEFELKEQIMRTMPGRCGYLVVNLKTGVGRGQPGYQVLRTVHSLVAAAFIGPRPDGMDICHYNGNKADNRLSNLRYDTKSANGFDTVRQGNNKSANKTHCPKGHEYTTENTYIGVRRSGPKKGHKFRTCRRCTIERAAAWDAVNRRKGADPLLTKTGEYLRNQSKGRAV